MSVVGRYLYYSSVPPDRGIFCRIVDANRFHFARGEASKLANDTLPIERIKDLFTSKLVPKSRPGLHLDKDLFLAYFSWKNLI
jgi:hypothetical protein